MFTPDEKSVLLTAKYTPRRADTSTQPQGMGYFGG
jgi:hypothetical protein